MSVAGAAGPKGRYLTGMCVATFGACAGGWLVLTPFAFGYLHSGPHAVAVSDLATGSGLVLVSLLALGAWAIAWQRRLRADGVLRAGRPREPALVEPALVEPAPREPAPRESGPREPVRHEVVLIEESLPEAVPYEAVPHEAGSYGDALREPAVREPGRRETARRESGQGPRELDRSPGAADPARVLSDLRALLRPLLAEPPAPTAEHALAAAAPVFSAAEPARSEVVPALSIAHRDHAEELPQCGGLLHGAELLMVGSGEEEAW